MSADSQPSDDAIRNGSGRVPARFQFDPEREDASAVIVETIAAVEGEDPRNVEPLYRTIDPDALDTVVRSVPDEGAATIRFPVKGYEIAIENGGAIEVRR